jgi:predicted aconitase
MEGCKFMKLTKEQKRMLSGEEGRGVRRAMEFLCGAGEALGAEKMVEISYAHLMPPEVMFFPYGRTGKWDRELTEELLKDVNRFKVLTTIEPKFVNLDVAEELGFTRSSIKEMEETQESATKLYENMGVVPTYTALPFYVVPGRFGEHVSIAESISILWYNTIFGSRCERGGGVTSLSAAITGCVPETGVHITENRYGEVVVRLKNDIDVEKFTGADYSALSYAVSRVVKEKKPVFVGLPSQMGFNQIKHLLAPIAVESGLDLMHIVGLTPEAPTLEAALGGREPFEEIAIGRKEIKEAYETACTAKSPEVDYVLLGCPHLTFPELREIAEGLKGNKISGNVKFIAVTTKLYRDTAREMGYEAIIEEAGGVLTDSMCIAFAGSHLKNCTIATNSIKGAFFWTGFSPKSGRRVWFGNIKDCLKSAITGQWEGSA